MSWNHRVFKHVIKCKGFEGKYEEDYYSIHEVFYKNKGTDDLTIKPSDVSFTIQPVRVGCDSIEGLRWTLTKMLEALDKPVLDYDEFMKESKDDGCC